MIVFVTTADHAYTLKTLLEYRCTALRGGLITMTYVEFTGWTKLPSATYILTDMDRLPDDKLEQVKRRCDAMDKDTDCKRLNDPRRSLNRWQLLQTLSREGINPQQVQRADQCLDLLRLPVFVRSEDGHGGNLTGLIHNHDALDAELQRLVQTGQWCLKQLWAIEFYDVRNDQGLYEKYSVFRIGEHYLACELFLSKHWVCKGVQDSERTPDAAALEARFLRENPHVELVRPIFEMAGVEYGRIDYAFHDGRLIVFEINTNPMLDPAANLHPAWRDSVIQFNQDYIRTMAALGLQRESPYYLSVGGATGDSRVVGGSLFRRVTRRILKSGRALEYEHDVVRFLSRFKRRRKPSWAN